MADIKNLYILDSSKTTVGILSNRMPFSLPFSDDLQERSLDDLTDTLTFTIPATHKEAYKVIAGGYILYPSLDEGEYKLYKIMEVTEDSDGYEYSKEVYCEISAQDDLIKNVVRPTSFLSVPIEEVLEYILLDTDWTVGNIDDLGYQDVTISDYPTKLQAVVDVIKQYGGELQFEYETNGTAVTSQLVSVYEMVGQETGKTFMHGKDVMGVQRIENRTKLITGLTAVGKTSDAGVPLSFYGTNITPIPDGYSVEGDMILSESAVEAYSDTGEHIIGVYKDDKATSPQELFENAIEVLKQYERPQMTYSVDVALLERLAGYEHERVNLGDTILVQDESVQPELYLNARIRKLSRSLTNPANDAVELGDYIAVTPPANDKIAEMQSLIRAKQEVWNKADEIPAIQSAINQLPTKEDLFSAQSQRLKVRYVRDWISGNNVDTTNLWSELKVFKAGVNIAKGIVPTSNFALTNPAYATNEVVDATLSAVGVANQDQYIQLDLGSVLEDVEYIQVWHNFSGSRIYNQHLVDVSSDGINWTRLYNSDRHGTHTETAEGFVVPVNSSAILANQAKEVTQVVQDVEELTGFKQSTEYELEQKVNLVDYNNTVNSINEAVAEKAGLEYVDGKLQAKADNDTVEALNTAIAAKAGLDYVNGQLVSKANVNTTYTKTEVDTRVNAKVATTTYNTDKAGIIQQLDAHSTSIEQNETAIGLKASQDSVDTLAGRVTSAESSLTVQAGQIATKVGQSQVDTGVAAAKSYADGKDATNLTSAKSYADGKASTAEANAKSYSDGKLAPVVTRVTNAETAITQTKASIELKADQEIVETIETDLGKVTSRVATAEATLTTQAGQINAKANQSEVNTLSGTVSSHTGTLDILSDKIELKVEANDVEDIARRSGNEVVKARYVRAYSNGSSYNEYNYIVELMVMQGDTNLAKGKTPTCSSAISNAQYITDGDINTDKYAQFSSGRQWVQVDLGSVYEDIDFINLYMYYKDARTFYGVEVQVSEDAVNWTKLYDSELNGRYKSTANGFTVLVNQQKAVQTMSSSIKQTADSIESKVEKNGIVSAINQSPESIKISATKIDIVGAVTFSAFDSSTQTKITNAEANASSALSTAGTAQSTANTAKSTADTAKSTADTAKTDAASAKTTAGTASTNATNAVTTANTANSTANTAKSTADTAQSTANTAKNTADTANSTANTVKGVISNFDTSIINANPIFLDWAGTYPTGYTGFSTGTGSGFSKVASGNGMGNAVKYVVGAGQSSFLNPAIVTTAPFSQYVTLEFTFKIESGTIDGAGILVRYNRGSAYTDNVVSIKKLVGNPVKDKWYTVSTVIKQNALSDFTGFQVYPMGGWTGFGETITAKTMQYDAVKLRPSTEQEIRAYESDLVLKDWTFTGKTTINGGKIEADSITAAQIKAGVITSDLLASTAITGKTISGGTITGAVITSVDPNSAKNFLKIDKNNLHAEGESVSGTITSYSIFDIDKGKLSGSYGTVTGTTRTQTGKWSLDEAGLILNQGTGANLVYLGIDGLTWGGGIASSTIAGMIMNPSNGNVDIFNSMGGTVTLSNVSFLKFAAGSYNANGKGLDMNNSDLYNVNHITINDAGAGEGIEWLGGNGFKIFESPNDLSNGAGNFQIAAGNTRLFTIGGDGVINSEATYRETGGSSPNLVISSTGYIRRISSAKKYKLDIEAVDTDLLAERVLDLQPKSWFDKSASESYADYLTKLSNGEEISADELDRIPYLRRNFGLIAEDLVDAGLDMYVQYSEPNAEGKRTVEGIDYDRVWTLLIPIVKELKGTVKELNERIAVLEGKAE